MVDIKRVAKRTAGAATLAAALVGLAGTATLAAGATGTSGTAGAAGAAGTGTYGEWTLNGTSGMMTIPLAGLPPTFPLAAFTTDSTSPAIDTGRTIWLSAATPFGSVFGSSQGEQYATLRTAAHLTPSTTTFTFRTPTPTRRWGFALGDIDADRVTISGTNAAGDPVPVASLGYQSTFNYCAVSPRPSGCGTGPFTDEPTWDPATATLYGSSSDTSGAAAWFRPAARLKTLTFTFSRSSGSPSYQVWFAALSRDISGRIRTVSGQTPPPTTVSLLNGGSGPVLNTAGEPVTTTTNGDGSYRFTGITPGRYTVAVTPPPGYVAHGAVRLSVDARHGNVSGANFTLRPVRPVAPVTG